MNRFVAGLLAAIPLAVLGVVYMLIRGRHMVAELKAADSGETMTENQLYLMFLVVMAFSPFMLGLASGLVYGWIDSSPAFLGLATGAAVLLSLAAIVSRTPLATLKVVMNFTVAFVLGILVPLLANR